MVFKIYFQCIPTTVNNTAWNVQHMIDIHSANDNTVIKHFEISFLFLVYHFQIKSTYLCPPE